MENIVFDGDKIIKTTIIERVYNRNQLLEEFEFMNQRLNSLKKIDIDENLPQEIKNIVEKENERTELEYGNLIYEIESFKTEHYYLWQ